MATGAKRLEVKKSLALEQMTIFAGVSKEACAWLSKHIQERLYSTGQIISEEGSLNEELYVIGTGSAEVVMYAGTAKEAVIAQLLTRDCFGEMAFIERLPRCATIRSSEFTRIYVLPWAAIEAFRTGWPDQHAMLILNLARAISRRLRVLDRVFGAKSF